MVSVSVVAGISCPCLVGARARFVVTARSRQSRASSARVQQPRSLNLLEGDGAHGRLVTLGRFLDPPVPRYGLYIGHRPL